MPESSIEILGHTVGGITYRYYAHRAPLAYKAIMTIPNPQRSDHSPEVSRTRAHAVGRPLRTLNKRLAKLPRSDTPRLERHL